MLELLNTYIIKSRNKFAFIFFVTILISNAVFAQDTTFVIPSLYSTQLKHNTFEVYLYGAASYQGRANLWTAINNGLHRKDGEEWYIDVGATLETSWSNVNGLHLCSSVGYKRVKYNYVDEVIWNNGVVSDWLSLEVNCDYYIFCVGVKSDVLLNSTMTNHNEFSYVGFYPNSFNKITFCPFAGMQFRFTKFKIEGRMGYYVAPYLNIKKIALHNFYTTHYDGLYWEVRLSARIFTSGTKIMSRSLF